MPLLGDDFLDGSDDYRYEEKDFIGFKRVHHSSAGGLEVLHSSCCHNRFTYLHSSSKVTLLGFHLCIMALLFDDPFLNLVTWYLLWAFDGLTGWFLYPFAAQSPISLENNFIFGALTGDERRLLGTMRLFPFSSCLGRSLVQQTDIETNRATLFLNVYDLTPANNYLYWFGLGFYHSGIEVHGLEYAFGADAEPASGVFQVEPRNCPGYIFRRSIILGTTDMSRSEFCSFMDLMANQYQGNSYNLIHKNCNHFTDEIFHCLTGKHIPGWVNRLARVGGVVDTLLPGSAPGTPFRQFPESQMYLDDGSDSGASSVTDDCEIEDIDRRVLLSPHGNVPLSDRPVRLAKETL